MPQLSTKLNARSADFKANADAMRGLIDDLNARLARIAEGGGEAARAKHVGRGKLLPRDRVEMLLDPGTPTNDGLQRCARVLTRPGSIVDARYPAAVAAGNVETSQRLVDVLLGALGKLAPERFPAASSGTMSNLTFGGVDLEGRAFSYYETLAGGAGAS